MTVQDNIKNAFKALIEGMSPEKYINIVESFNEGEWATVYICASRFSDEPIEGEDMPISPFNQIV